MSNGFQSFLAVLATYLITQVGYWALKCNPSRDLPALPGRLLDFTIWILVFFLARWVILKTTAPKHDPP